MSDTLNSAICHGILAASSGWALSQCLDYKFASVGFGLYLVNGVLGVLSYGVAWDNLKLYKVYSGFWRWSLTVILPLIGAQLYVNYGFGYFIALLHFVFPFIYMVTSQLVKRSRLPLLELFHIGSLLSILCISFVNNQYYGISVAVSYVISFYVVGTTGMIQNTPSKDLFNISVIFSNYFTVRALKGQ